MKKTSNLKRTVNILNLLISVLVFGTGLILFTQFHIGSGAHQKEWYGIGKNAWLIIHQISAIGFLIGLAIHLQMHWKYIKNMAKRWRINLPEKLRKRTRYQIIFFIITIVVLSAGFYPWVAMPDATLEVEVYHDWIDVHNRIGIIYLIGIIIHIKKRWRRMFKATKKNKILDLRTIGNPAN